MSKLNWEKASRQAKRVEIDYWLSSKPRKKKTTKAKQKLKEALKQRNTMPSEKYKAKMAKELEERRTAKTLTKARLPLREPGEPRKPRV